MGYALEVVSGAITSFLKTGSDIQNDTQTAYNISLLQESRLQTDKRVAINLSSSYRSTALSCRLSRLECVRCFRISTLRLISQSRQLRMIMVRMEV
jgi:hypothetical protein